MTHAGISDGIRRISHSEIQNFKQCRRSWWLRWYRGLRPRVESLTEKRSTGDRAHRALQGWYVPDGTPRVDPREGLEHVILEDRALLRDQLVASGAQVPDDHDEMKKLVKANDLERIMIQGYMEWLAETGEDAYLRVIAPEVFLETTLPELGDDSLHIVGKLDVRVYRVSDGRRLFIDHKTRDVAPTLDELRRDEQMLHYELLEEAGEDGDGEPCDGALYNVLRRVKRSAQAKPPFYVRHLVTHNQHTRKAYRSRLVATVRDMIKVEEALDAGADHLDTAYPTPSRDCGWRCPFARICPMFDDGSDVERLLTDHYQSDNPLYYYGNSLPNADRTGV